MRAFLKGLATLVLVIGVVVTLISIIIVFSDGSSNVSHNLLIVGACLSSLLVSGAVWLLADIAEWLARSYAMATDPVLAKTPVSAEGPLLNEGPVLVKTSVSAKDPVIS